MSLERGKALWYGVAAGILSAAGAFAAGSAGFEKMPPEAAVSLRVTRGQPFSSGLVFVDGKYIAPPYVVERYGTVIRINSIQVTGQIVPWLEFLKTQEGVRKVESPGTVEPVEKAAHEPAGPVSDAEGAPSGDPVVRSDDDDTDIDDLFEDEAKPKPAPRSVERPKPVEKPKPSVQAKPVPKPAEVRYVLTGAFKPNARTVEMVERINRIRRMIDERLRKGNVIFFGSRYSRVMGDAASAKRILETLPDCQRRANSSTAFAADMRAKNLSYLPGMLLDDLYRHRVDYPQLQERRRELNRKEDEWNSLLNPLY